MRSFWADLSERRPTVAQFIMFSLLSTGMTVLQLALMPLFKGIFNLTPLVDQTFQALAVSTNTDGSPFYLFDYAAGALPGGGGGLAYFLAVQVTLLIAQVINFFLQRNVTFKSDTNIWRAAAWYFVAYVVITFAAAALQGFYKEPIYQWMVERWGSTGEVGADLVTMIINALISVVVYFPILKIIFRQMPGTDGGAGAGPADVAVAPTEPLAEAAR
ncbi:hypothetical protein [Oerskovia paurometabola]|uniref:GtrA-like protein domain-containing protein n=1 Tax=Oerskovia paurometabola TaxID=162170 RepID=A0ABW1XAU7_9CELL|nr:hypothetical protein [Oerskovia paurometabola]MBM7497283.1 ABC-type multidrug transport system fused ATPase/permease subunit [Oerskovia paurometabola]